MADPAVPSVYEIRVRGHFGPRWAGAFSPLHVATVETAAEDGVTVLRGAVADQAALHGVLRCLERSGVVLLSLRCVDEACPHHAVG